MRQTAWGERHAEKPSRAFGKRSILTRPSLLPPPDAALSARAGNRLAGARRWVEYSVILARFEQEDGA